jgi:hypothetical protein
LRLRALQNFKGYRSQVTLKPFYQGLEKLLTGHYVNAATFFELGVHEGISTQGPYLRAYGHYLRAHSLKKGDAKRFETEISTSKQEALRIFETLRLDFEVGKIRELYSS